MPPSYLPIDVIPYITQEKLAVKILTALNSCAISSNLEAVILSTP